MWDALQSAWHAYHEMTAVRDAVHDAVSAGQSPLAILRAAATASAGTLDDAAVDVLEDGARKAITALHALTGAAAWTLQQVPALRTVLDESADTLTDAAYRLGQWRSTLAGWLDES